MFNADDVQMAASLRGFSVVPFFLWLFISKNCLQMQVQCVCVRMHVRVCVSRVCAVIIKLTVPPAVALFIQFQWVNNSESSTSCSSNRGSRGSASVGSITMPILMVITMRP